LALVRRKQTEAKAKAAMTEQEPIPEPELIALVVNDETVTLPELLRHAQLRGHLGFLQTIADLILIRQAAAQLGLEISDEELQAAADEFRAAHNLHKAADLLRWLAAQHLPLSAWEAGLEDDLLTEKLRAALTADKVELYFAQNKLAFEAATITRIVVAEESLAKELRAQICEEEADFYALARAHSLDAATRPASGYVGGVRRADLSATLEAAIFGAAAGAVVGPCKTEAGWELVKVEARPPAQLDAATRAQIEALLFAEWLAERRAKARLDIPLWALLDEEEEDA
jgi:putative peptide maturation system protein